tara:strand:+ start:25428 stop:25940 length:513 start_codon:yes stop_codon:yes gene_type:complete
MSRLVAQLLELAQAEVLVPSERPVVNLAEIGQSVVRSLDEVAQSSNQRLVFLDRGDSEAHAHSEAVYRIYRNLIENAISRAPSDRPIEVSAGPGPRIAVRDFGPGIAIKDRAKIFEKFWQGGTRSEGGAGLGLGIVKSLTDALDAEIKLDCPNDGGAIFTVCFQSKALSV